MSLATAVPGTRVISAEEILGIPGGNSSPEYTSQRLLAISYVGNRKFILPIALMVMVLLWTL